MIAKLQLYSIYIYSFIYTGLFPVPTQLPPYPVCHSPAQILHACERRGCLHRVSCALSSWLWRMGEHSYSTACFPVPGLGPMCSRDCSMIWGYLVPFFISQCFGQGAECPYTWTCWVGTGKMKLSSGTAAELLNPGVSGKGRC